MWPNLDGVKQAETQLDSSRAAVTEIIMIIWGKGYIIYSMKEVSFVCKFVPR